MEIDVMKKYFAYEGDGEICFFDTLEEAKARHIATCESNYECFLEGGSQCLSFLERSFYGEVKGFSLCSRKRLTEDEKEEYGVEYDFEVGDPVLNEMGAPKP